MGFYVWVEPVETLLPASTNFHDVALLLVSRPYALIHPPFGFQQLGCSVSYDKEALKPILN
jgi:hypothetical protein